jgi:hypothetical protein
MLHYIASYMPFKKMKDKTGVGQAPRSAMCVNSARGRNTHGPRHRPWNDTRGQATTELTQTDYTVWAKFSKRYRIFQSIATLGLAPMKTIVGKIGTIVVGMSIILNEHAK